MLSHDIIVWHSVFVLQERSKSVECELETFANSPVFVSVKQKPSKSKRVFGKIRSLAVNFAFFFTLDHWWSDLSSYNSDHTYCI